jgi:hypothetical protein
MYPARNAEAQAKFLGKVPDREVMTMDRGERTLHARAAERRKNPNIQFYRIRDCGQTGGACDCRSGKPYADCCGTPDAARVLIRGASLLENLTNMEEKGSVSGEIMSRLLSLLPGDTFMLTTSANIVRAQKNALENPIAVPPVLYHVTFEDCVSRILREGLKPRSQSGNDNWDWADAQSHQDLVYLTDANVPFYAYGYYTRGKAISVLAVDTAQLDKSQFYPDEDYVAYVENTIVSTPRRWPDNGKEFSFEAGARAVRDDIHKYQHYWNASLTGYGNLAYRGVIPPCALKVALHGAGIHHRGEWMKMLTHSGDYFLAAYPIRLEDHKKDTERVLRGEIFN